MDLEQQSNERTIHISTVELSNYMLAYMIIITIILAISPLQHVYPEIMGSDYRSFLLCVLIASITFLLCAIFNHIEIRTRDVGCLDSILVIASCFMCFSFWASISSHYLVESVSEALMQTLKIPNSINQTLPKSYWNNIQSQFQCCGVNSPSNWDELPQSCCNSFYKKECSLRSNHLFRNGCYQVIQNDTAIDLGFLKIGCGVDAALILILLSIYLWKYRSKGVRIVG